MVQIITSVYNAHQFIDQFLENVREQTVFGHCFLYLLNCDSKDYPQIEQFCQDNPNAYYEYGPKDCGVYQAWNHMIYNSDSDYITNWNIDDRRDPSHIERCIQRMYVAGGELCYAGYYEVEVPNTLVAHIQEGKIQAKRWPLQPPTPEFIFQVGLHCAPVWARSVHEKAGMFDESLKSAADLKFWLNALKNQCRFAHVPEYLVAYYRNPEGVSSRKKDLISSLDEVKMVRQEFFGTKW